MVSALREFVNLLTDFVNTLLPFSLGSTIIAVLGIIILLAAWRIIS